MAAPTATTEAPAGHKGFPPFETRELSLAARLAGADFRPALRADGEGGVAAHRLDPCRAIEAHRRRYCGGAALEGTIGRGARRLREGACRRAQPAPRAIANATRERQAAAAEETNKRLEAELHERLAAAEKSIAATRNAAMGNVGAIAADTASAIVERLIGKAPAAHEVAAALGDAGKR